MKAYAVFSIGIVVLLAILLISTPNTAKAEQITANNFTVTWYPVKDDITEKIYDASVQNLDSGSERNFNLSVVFFDATFDISKIKDVTVYELKNISHTETIFSKETVFYNVTTSDNSTNQTIITIKNFTVTIANGSKIELYPDWLPTKSQLIKNPVKAETKSKFGQISIPRLNSKDTGDTFNGTKWFRLQFNVPIGSTGAFGFIDENSGILYHPTWSSNWTTKYPINISQNVTSTLDRFPYVINGSYIWFNSLNASTTGGIQSDCDDLRAIDGAAEAFSRNISIESCNSTQIVAWTNANLNVGANSSKTDYLYTGNLTVGSENSRNNVWDENYTLVIHLSNFLDDSRFGNNMTIGGGTVNSNTTCVFGNCSTFDTGDDSFINVSDSTSVSFDTEFTIEFWGRTRTWGSGQPPLSKWGDTDGAKEWIIASTNSVSISCLIKPEGVGEVEARADANNITLNEWHYYACAYDNSAFRFYVDGRLMNTTSQSGNIQNTTSSVFLGERNSPSATSWKGSIDEVRLSNINRSAAYIYQNYRMGRESMSRLGTASFTITFNITSGEDGSAVNNVHYECNNTASGMINSSQSLRFDSGSYACNFGAAGFFNETVNFVADNIKTVTVILSESGKLTKEEHEMLEALRDCIINGVHQSCEALKLLQNINRTVTVINNTVIYINNTVTQINNTVTLINNTVTAVNTTVNSIWNQIRKTNQSVVLTEIVTNTAVNTTHNLSISYSVSVPIKSGYVVVGNNLTNPYLPVRLSYWFLEDATSICLNQGIKPANVSSPYCQSISVYTLGQISSTLNFSVQLRPNLPNGNYTIVRSIDIDPEEIWFNYGREQIGTVQIFASGDATGSVSLAENNQVIQAPVPTGLVIGNVLNTSILSLILSILTLTLVGYLVLARKKI